MPKNRRNSKRVGLTSTFDIPSMEMDSSKREQTVDNGDKIYVPKNYITIPKVNPAYLRLLTGVINADPEGKALPNRETRNA